MMERGTETLKQKVPAVAGEEQQDNGKEHTLTTVKETVLTNFPKYWDAVEAGLSVCATLLLHDNANPVALIYVGGPSTGKTTVASMFEGAKFGKDDLVYRSDKFTPAAFVSQAANRTPEELEGIDLIDRIKHKVLVTPELATIFRGKRDDLVDRFSTLTRVLDGQGLKTDSGTHGTRGKTGDYLFAWLGATTPFDKHVWDVMAQLGSRLFFLVMAEGDRVTLEDLIENSVPPSNRVSACRQVVHDFLEPLFNQYRGVRGVQWSSEHDPRVAREWIGHCAILLAAMRAVLPEGTEEGPVSSESPYRGNAVLYNLARGHALIHGRTQLTAADVPMIVKITLCSIPEGRRAVLQAGLTLQRSSVTVAEVQEQMKAKHPDTARKAIQEVERLGLGTFEQNGAGKTAHFQFDSKWSWWVSSEFQAVIQGAPPTYHANGGV